MFSQDRLKLFIKECYGTQRAFAKEINVSHTEISFYLNATRKPGFDMITKFHKAGLSIDWLISGNGIMYANNETGKALRNKQNPELNTQQEKIEKIKELLNEL